MVFVHSQSFEAEEAKSIERVERASSREAQRIERGSLFVESPLFCGLRFILVIKQIALNNS